MARGAIHLSSSPPPPPDADFALYIKFKKGDGNPGRVFQAADAMIRAFQKLDHALIGAIDNHIEPTLVLEDIEAGSLKIWLKNLLVATDDDALKSLDWKQQIGKYLVRAKYIYIEWANKADPAVGLPDLARNLTRLAAETDVRHMPDYSPPSFRELTDAASGIEDAKRYLIAGDSIAYLPSPTVVALPSLSFDLSIKWEAEELVALARKETTRFENMPMNLIVKRPDYLGSAMWDFRHGKSPISAKIADDSWLKSFQSREVDVRPGDALRCLVTLERSYGYDNELIDETYTVTRVEAVLQNQLREPPLEGLL